MKSHQPVRVREKPHIYADGLAALSPQERARIRAMLDDPLYLKFLRIVARQKPSSMGANLGSGARDAFSDARANARLSEIRGWEMYEAAIFLALNEPPQIKQALQETFPDEGRADAAWTQPPLPAEPTRTTRKKR